VAVLAGVFGGGGVEKDMTDKELPLKRAIINLS